MNSGENNSKKRFDLGDNDGKDMYNFNPETGMMANTVDNENQGNNIPQGNPMPNQNANVQMRNNQSQSQNQEAVSFEENGSFCRLSSDGGILEIDLRSNKQRGVENRYLSISVTGVNENNEFSKAEMFLLSEAQLKALQVFMAKLNWND